MDQYINSVAYTHAGMDTQAWWWLPPLVKMFHKLDVDGAMAGDADTL